MKIRIGVDWKKVWNSVTFCGRQSCHSLCEHEQGSIKRTVEKQLQRSERFLADRSLPTEPEAK